MDFLALVRLFVRDLIRRQLLWALVAIVLGMLAVVLLTNQAFDAALTSGTSYDIATRRATDSLDKYAGLIRGLYGVIAIFLATLMGPEARKNGTTQFVLSMQVSRYRLLAAQYVALCILVTAGVLTTHLVYCAAALRYDAISLEAAALGWVWLLGPALLLAASTHAVAATMSFIEVGLVVLGAPLALSILHSLLAKLQWCPQALDTLVTNLQLLFPFSWEVTPWPNLGPNPGSGFTLVVLHQLFASALWLAVGLRLLQLHDFGSRTATK